MHVARRKGEDAMALLRTGAARALFLMVGLVSAGCTQAQPAAAPAIEDAAIGLSPVDRQVEQLRAAFLEEVPRHTTPSSERVAEIIARGKAMIADNAVVLDHPQLLVVVDRNPAAQDLLIVLARPQGVWDIIGSTKVSTGQRGRFDYYITPTGVFLHTDAILGYRAEGTYNENGIRGLGLKGMRVWDFGWQNATKGWRSDGERGDIRLLMHATDPAGLEQRIGRPASQGCIRIPTALNKFLDRHGVLDADYERAARTDTRYAHLLRPDRTPTPLAGNAVVVVDSQDPL